MPAFLLRWLNAMRFTGRNQTADKAQDGAALACRRAEALENVQTHVTFGREALLAGHMTAATAHYRSAMLLDTGNPERYAALAYVLTTQGLYEEAWPHLEQALRLDPENPDIHLQRGNFQQDVGELVNAQQCYLAALALRPDQAEVHSNLGHVLVRQGELSAAIASFESALSSNPGHLATHSNLLYALSIYPDPRGARYRRVAQEYGEKVLVLARPREWCGIVVNDRRRQFLRVGVVSGDFRQHPAGIFTHGVLARVNPKKLELVAYSMNPQDDALTEKIRPHFSAWHPISHLSDEEAANKIYADGIDVLIDLAGHGARNRLPVFAWKPAPVQVSWLGHLASTGVSAIDYVLADPVSTPDSVRSQFTEEIWHLPETIFCFTPPAAQPRLQVAPPPALRNGFITFGNFQRLNKLSDTTLNLWARVLKAIPQSRLWLRNEAIGSEQMHALLLQRLARAGIPASRVTFGDYRPEWEDYLTAYRDVDMMLDTFPHPGVTTTCEALWMGVPTVTLARGGTLGRIGASLLTCAGLPQWVAWDEDEYVAVALKHSADLAGLTQLRAGLRQQVAVTALFDAGKFAPQLENALLGIWQRKMADMEW